MAGVLQRAACAVLLSAIAGTAPAADTEWTEIGGSPGGQRYSPLADIHRKNVHRLKIAWTYRHGDFSPGNERHGPTAFQATPLLIDGTLYFCTPYNRLVAIDAGTGSEKWKFDPNVKLDGVFSPVCRGVAHWHDSHAKPGTACTDTLYMGTLDARLIAVDARNGERCRNFGRNGEVNLLEGLGKVAQAEYYLTSPPQVIRDRVVTGAFVRDGQRTSSPGGALRAFHARSGKLAWVWDPVPPGMRAVTAEGLARGEILTPGTPNVWALMSADPGNGLLFAPTGNAAPDHYGGERKNLDYYASSYVALDAASGQLRWNFQTVRHDLWDYDVAAQPVLYTHRADGREIPALVGATKLGFIFLLDRLTGKPLFPVEERRVAQSTLEGEPTSPTQPFPTRPAPLHPLLLKRDRLWGLTFWDRNRCRKRFDELEYHGVFTPPSFRDTLQYPGLGGGINWGSVSVDPVRNRMIANLQVAPFTLRLQKRGEDDGQAAGGDLVRWQPQEGTPYTVVRDPYLSPLQLPCVPPPWGRLVAIDLNTGEKLWDRELGTLKNLAPFGDRLKWGTPNSGGSLQTGGGLVFIGATMDKFLRAFDTDNGAELWRHELPYAAHATPMTYQLRRRQYVVVAAGGHGALGTETGDALVAFTLE